MSSSGRIQEKSFTVRRWQWLVYFGGTFLFGVLPALLVLLKPLDLFGLGKWLKALGWSGYLSLMFISFVIATIVTGFKISRDVKRLESQSSLGNIEQNTTKQLSRMLRYELKSISRSVKSLVASILELSDILDFLRGNKFYRLCERYDVNTEWQLIQDIIIGKSRHVTYHTEDTFYNFINTLYLMGNDFLQKFLGDFQKRYEEEHPNANFTQIESELKNLEKVSQLKHREEIREEYNQMLTERKLFL
jgi:hypothetical protein